MKTLKTLLFAALATIGFSFAAQAEKYTTADYVQDGLVAMWDYSSGLTTDGWTDMILGKTFTYTGTVAPAEDGSGLEIAANSSSYATLTSTDTSATFDLCKSGTFEIVFKASADCNGQASVIQSSKTSGYMVVYNGSGKLSFAGNNVSQSYYADKISTEWKTISAIYMSGAINKFPLVNGLFLSALTTKETFSSDDSGRTVLGGRNSLSGNYMKFGGTIASIRLYSRKLTQGEQYQNQAVDKARINGSEKPFQTISSTETTFGSETEIAQDGVNYMVVSYRNTSKDGFLWTVPPGVLAVDVLVVGGGGSGGSPSGTASNPTAGGGAGGLVYRQGFSVVPGDEYQVTVGAGGASVGGSSGLPGKSGEDSSFVKAGDDEANQLIAKGGGWGRWGYASNLGGEGGSGGGGSNSVATQPTQPCGGFGNPGGDASGGGAGGSGSNRGTLPAEAYVVQGGTGMAIGITGEEQIYACGGDGGDKGITTKTTGVSGRDGYGDGGAGGSGKYGPSGKGGDGVVIIRYAVPKLGTGVQISAEGGQYGTPNPDYGHIEKDFPEVYTCPSEVALEDGVRAALAGWALYDADGNLVDSSANHPSDPITSAKFTVDKALTLRWQWKKEYQLTATAGENGDLKDDVSGWYEEGAEIEVEAVPNAGYGFFGWTGDVATADAEKNPLTLTMGATPLSVSAVFAQAVQGSYTVASSAGTPYGEVTPAYGDTEGTFLVGKTLSFSAPQYVVLEENAKRMKCAGYKVYSKESGEVIAEDSPAAVGGVISVDVVFSELFTFEWQWVAEYAVTTACDAEQGSVTGAGWYEVEAQVSIQATPKSANFAFDYWAGDVPEGCETANPLVFAMPAEAVVFTANFVQTYAVKVTTYHGYTVSVLGGTSSFPAYFREGALVTLQYGPNATAKYTWDGLPEDAVIDEAARTVSFTMPTEELNLTLDGEDVINPDTGWYTTYKVKAKTYTAVAFTKTGKHEFIIPKGVHVIDYLVVGGGGAGGSGRGAGGGGAGGFVTNDAPVAVTPKSTLTIQVGAGGAVGQYRGNNGKFSSISNGTDEIAFASGGGGGACGSGITNSPGKYPAQDGGSGGGGSFVDVNIAGGQGMKGQGCAGGTVSKNKDGAGGGGAGEPGGADTNGGGKGGDGLSSWITGNEVWYAGGGGGGRASSSHGGVAGNGGGGTGGPWASSTKGYAGTDGLGGGGGGCGYAQSSYSGGKGGDGIVIIRYVSFNPGLAIMLY